MMVLRMYLHAKIVELLTTHVEARGYGPQPVLVVVGCAWD